MKYIWIVMLVLIEIAWILLVISDIYTTVRMFGKDTEWDDFEEITKFFIKFHLAGLFMYSLLTWIGVYLKV